MQDSAAPFDAVDFDPFPDYRALLLNASQPDRAAWVEIEGGLAQVSVLLDGFVQAIPLGDHVVMYVNEDGRSLGLPPNWAAHAVLSQIAARSDMLLDDTDPVVGNVLLLGTATADGVVDGREHDAPEAAVELCRAAGLAVSDD